MEQTDWLEMKELIRGAEGAILSGTLNEWQHASTSTFHILATALVSLNDRLARLESATNQPMVNPIVWEGPFDGRAAGQ